MVGTSTDAPRVLEANKVAQINTDVSISYPMGGQLGPLVKGRVFEAFGTRIVLYVSPTSVVYIEGGTFFTQTLKGFVQDVTSYPAVQGAHGAAGMVRLYRFLLENGAEFAIGVAAGTTLVRGLVILGVDLASWVVQNRKKIDAYVELVRAILAARSDLKRCAPTLYDKVICPLILSTLKRHSYDNLLHAPAKSIARMVGQIVGEIGAKKWDGRLTAFWAVFSVVKNLAVKSLTSIGDALKGTGKGDWEKIVGVLKDVGVQISAEDLHRIQDEVHRNGREIARVFERFFGPLQKILAK